ncbi:hypothetical protein [Enterobacter sp. DE0047]|uniref:hypothetical protein n=1 Tax=Enterobacter sp. DE0047 TaxID=2584949 RepID=UPI0011A923E2|nr:hypothetical protein [Enterobacter sp. DE0047]
MGALEAIIGGIVTLVLLLVGVLHVGKSQGKTEARADAKEREAGQQVSAATEAAERRVEAMKGAADVQQTVNHMSDDDIARELLDNWQRPGGY